MTLLQSCIYRAEGKTEKESARREETHKRWKGEESSTPLPLKSKIHSRHTYELLISRGELRCAVEEFSSENKRAREKESQRPREKEGLRVYLCQG